MVKGENMDLLELIKDMPKTELHVHLEGVLKSLKVDRIGHGTRAYEDNALLDYLIENQIPIEMCPISNVKTGVVNNLKEHPFLDKVLEGDLLGLFNCTSYAN